MLSADSTTCPCDDGSIHQEMLIAAQANHATERRERHRVTCTRDVEEKMIGLRMQQHVVLARPAVWTVVGEPRGFAALVPGLAKVRPACELVRERVIDFADVRDREPRERFGEHLAVLTVEANDLDR